MQRTILTTTGQAVPAWSHELMPVLRIHGELSNRELAELVDRPEPRVSEVVRKLRFARVLTTRKIGKEVRIKLDPSYH